MSIYKETRGVPSRDQIVPGMAYFTGTGPKGATCGKCSHFGDAMTGRRQHCRLYIEMMGKLGTTIEPNNLACKYYAKKKS